MVLHITLKAPDPLQAAPSLSARRTRSHTVFLPSALTDTAELPKIGFFQLCGLQRKKVSSASVTFSHSLPWFLTMSYKLDVISDRAGGLPHFAS